MKQIITADGTETFLNEEVGESYHSYTGAVEEAFKKYAVPCKIKELAKSHLRNCVTGDLSSPLPKDVPSSVSHPDKVKIRILDICSGMFYNSAAALDVALEENPDCEIEIIGLENDLEIIKKIQEVNPPIKSYKIIKKINFNKLEVIDKKIKINLLLGDARERIKELESDSFDAVFLDPFSPKTAPEMWGVDFLKEIFRVIKEKKILATYTCARIVREKMKEAGFDYDDGPIVGRRGPGTIGWKENW